MGVLMGENSQKNIFLKKSRRKIWIVEKNALSLHPQNENNE